jgi:thiosulfate/3-mercaptopyruvate sulfurtransferase
LVALLLTPLLTIILTGCGSNSGGETAPIPPQTGDVAVFPNAALLASLAEVNSPTTPTIVLDARRSDAEYNAGHIPGAIFAQPSLFENNGVLLSDSELATILGNMGITRTSKIIIYDDTITSRGAAGRLFWILEYLGCTDVRILNGGWDQWENEKEGTQGTTVATVISPIVFTAQINSVAVKRVDKDYVASHLPPDPNNFILIDVRTDEEYQGAQPGNTDPRLGHIPGAINFPYPQCFNADKTVLNFNDLKLLLEAHGITNNKELVAYSTVGHRSGFFYFLCRLMGYDNISNYVGSIVDWGIADPTLYPMNTGMTP